MFYMIITITWALFLVIGLLLIIYQRNIDGKLDLKTKALKEIANMPNEKNEWDAVKKYKKAKAIAKGALKEDER